MYSLVFISSFQHHNELAGSVLLQPKQLQKFGGVRGAMLESHAFLKVAVLLLQHKDVLFWSSMFLGSEQLYQAFWVIDSSFQLSQGKGYYLLKSSVCICAPNFFRDCCDLSIPVS